MNNNLRQYEGFELTKTIPSRKKTIKFDWIKKDFMNFKIFREARERLGLSIPDTCYWCRSKFSDADMMALACVAKKGNKFLCQDCISR
jgi:hypothetical protein